MDPLLALGVAVGLVIVAGIAGVVLRARSGLRRPAGVDRFDAADADIPGFGGTATIVQFSTEFCGRCPGVRRALSTLAEADPAVVYTDVDLTRRPDLASRYRVLQTPTVLVLDASGAVAARFAGAVGDGPVRIEIDNLRRRADVALV